MVLIRARPLRAVAHLAAWAPFAYGLARSLQNGWVAISDNSVIAFRSWDVLTAHGPLVGQATRFGFGVFDLGPLQYWLLTLPVHLDAVHGVLWGATLWCMVAASLVIEAAWSAGRELAGLAASAVVIGVALWIPAVTTLPCWNPWFGLMFFLAALAAGWAAMSGHRGWWPVAVIGASIAAQAHLMFAIAAVVIVILTFAVGLADTIRSKAGYRWAITGAVAGAACWAAPLVQQFTATRGNMTALFSPSGPPVTKGGVSFGLKAIAAAIQPPAYWWLPVQSLSKLSAVEGRSAASGIAALVIIGVALAIAVVWLRSRRVAALAALSLVLAVTALITYASIPTSDITMTTSTFNNLRYLLAPMYPLGVLTWLSAGAVAVLAGRRVLARARGQAAVPGGTAAGAAAPAGTARGTRITALAGAGVLVVAAVLTAAQSDRAQSPRSFVMKAVGVAAGQIEHKITRQAVALRVIAPNNHYRRQLTLGLAYALRSDGYHPEIARAWALQLGHGYWFRGRRMPLATVSMGTSTLAVQIVKHPEPWMWAGKPRLSTH